MSAKRTYTLTRRQCEEIKEADRIYVLNAKNMLKGTVRVGYSPNGDKYCHYPSWVTLNLKRLGDEAIRRWEKAHPIPATVIAVAFDKAETDLMVKFNVQATQAERRAA